MSSVYNGQLDTTYSFPKCPSLYMNSPGLFLVCSLAKDGVLESEGFLSTP
jgi:hypothetical protein